MLSRVRRIVWGTGFGAILAAATFVNAALAQMGADDATTRAILAQRENIRTAVANKDSKALEAIYSDRFNHIRENGRADMKRDRIAVLLSGQDAIELAPEDQMLIQTYGPDTAVLSAVSPIRDKKTGRSADFQWLQVWVRMDGKWQLAVSQANRVPKPGR